MASREDIERVLKAAKERAKGTAKGGQPESSRDSNGRVGQSMCVIGSRSGFSKRPGRPYKEREVEEACGPNAPSLEEATAVAAAARWGNVSSVAVGGATIPNTPEDRPAATVPKSGPKESSPDSRALASILTGLCEEDPPASDEGDCTPEQAGRVLGRLLAKHRGNRDRRGPSKKARRKTPREESVSPQMVMSLRKGDVVELHAKGLSRSPRTLTIESSADTETGKALGIVYVRTSSGHVRSGHRAGGMLTLRGETLRFQPTMLQAEVDVGAMSIRRRAPAPTRSAEANEANAEGTMAHGASQSSAARPNERATVGIDVLLADLKDGARGVGRRVERKHVAKALRQMLHNRHRGFSVRTERGAKLSTLEVVPARGAKRFTAEHRQALLDLFGDDAGRDDSLTVLVSRFIGDANSKATGIGVEHADDFRRRVAEAAGLPVPALFPVEQLPRAPQSNVTTTGSGLGTDEVVRLVEMLLSRLREEGIVARATHRPGQDDVVIDYDAHSGVRGQARLFATHTGVAFVVGAKENPTNARVFELFVDAFAPLVSRGKPDKLGNRYTFRGLPRSRRTKNLDARARVLGRGLGMQETPAPFSVVELPPDEAANSRPTAAERGRHKGVRAVAEGSAPAPAPAPKPAVRKVSPSKAEPPNASPVRMDHVLRDLNDAAQAKGTYVERKHVAKALRVMLHARRRGISITTPQYSFATTLDIGSGKGRSSFSPEQNDALGQVFGKDGGRSNRFTVLVSRFVNDSSSVPTGVRPERIDEFRRLVAKAAGLPKPEPFSAGSRERTSKSPAVVSSDRMSDEDVQTLLTAFVQYANHHKESPEALGVHLVGRTIQVRAEGGPVAFSVLANPSGFTVLFGTERRLGELFLNTFALPMRGDEKATTEGSRIFSWAPKAERRARWAKTMSGFSLPVVKTGEPLGVGRDDHEQRRDARADRLRERAAKARGEAHARFEASKDVPPLGEPIKIGHHSEKRHRKMIERAQSNARKSFEASKKAKHLDARADAAETNTTISSDDPRALERLRAKLAGMEAEREEVKRLNRLARQGKLSEAENPMNPLSLRDIMGARKYPLPGYAMRNQGAEIRRVRQRIEAFSMREGRVARSYERGGVRVLENGELNRLQVFTDGKPPQKNRTWLKRSGFRWARSEGAWQRQIGDGAWNLAMQYIDTFIEKDEDTPYARVEAPPPKPSHTDADIEFWREEFAMLDVEFPGTEFEGPTHAKVIEALRGRKSGHPEMQASAYGEVRTGRRTLEEAVERMYHYNRHARPKPRPKRPRKAAVSSMGRDAFVAAVQEHGAELGGQLFASKTPTGVYFNHYNVPKDVTDGARRENNRLMLSVDGWERDGAPPKGGKVKLEVMVAARLSGLRGRTSTPEAMVDVVAQMFRRHSALESR